MSIETIRDGVRRVVAKAGFLSADEVTDAVLDLIRAELSTDAVVAAASKASFEVGSNGRVWEDKKVWEDTRDAFRRDMRAGLAAVVTALGGDRV